MKFYKIEEPDLMDIFDELNGGPYYFYTYADQESYYVLISDTEIDADDVETVLEQKIEELEEDDD